MLTLYKKAETIEEKEALILHRLITLTDTKRIEWQNKSDLPITKHYTSKIDCFTFEAERLRGGQPQLIILKNGQAIMLITGGLYGHTAESLITRIELYRPPNDRKPIETIGNQAQRNKDLDEVIGRICVHKK
ncbi:MAG: hypothetical protein Q7S34_00430 [bacterium]|nr:hypothetical protein [bacterium]